MAAKRKTLWLLAVLLVLFASSAFASIPKPDIALQPGYEERLELFTDETPAEIAWPVIDVATFAWLDEVSHVEIDLSNDEPLIGEIELFDAEERPSLFRVKEKLASGVLGSGAENNVSSISELVEEMGWGEDIHAYPFTEPANGKVYARARWYDPQTGTFMSPDPVGYSDSSNLYSFCGGDPVNCSDPDGRRGTLRQGRVSAPLRQPTTPTVPSGPAQPLSVPQPPRYAPGSSEWERFQQTVQWAQAEEQRQKLRVTGSAPGVLQVGTPAILNDPVLQMQLDRMIQNGRLPMLPGPTPYSQQAQLSPENANLLAQYHNREVRKKRGRPSHLENFRRGRNFNALNAFNYPYRELYVEKPDGSTGYWILDGYDPFIGEIVSRKDTQLGEVQPGTGISYLQELVEKYPVGARIASVESTDPDLRGLVLEGQQILEVPIQSRPVPRSVLDEAKRLNIQIRDIAGRVYE